MIGGRPARRGRRATRCTRRRSVPSNRLLSPDWPGTLKRTVESITGATCLFAQGATGNIGPGPDGFTDDVRVVHRLGRQVGCEAARVYLGLDLPRRPAPPRAGLGVRGATGQVDQGAAPRARAGGAGRLPGNHAATHRAAAVERRAGARRRGAAPPGRLEKAGRRRRTRSRRQRLPRSGPT
jgi:hypothetical protein